MLKFRSSGKSSDDVVLEYIADFQPKVPEELLQSVKRNYIIGWKERIVCSG